MELLTIKKLKVFNKLKKIKHYRDFINKIDKDLELKLLSCHQNSNNKNLDGHSQKPLAPLVQALEGAKIPFDRIIRTPGSEREAPMIYLKVKTYNIISVYNAIEEAGFTVHVPEDQPQGDD